MQNKDYCKLLQQIIAHSNLTCLNSLLPALFSDAVLNELIYLMIAMIFELHSSPKADCVILSEHLHRGV